MFIKLQEDFIDSFIVEYVSIKHLPYPIELRRIQEGKIHNGMGISDFVSSRLDVVSLMLAELFPYLNYEDYTVFYVRNGNIDRYFVLQNGFLELVDNTNNRYYYGGTKYGM